MSTIPFVDLKAQFSAIGQEVLEAINNVIADSAFVRGKYVDEFEFEFAMKNGVKYCIGVGNGTDAIYIALKMLGIGEGDEVITTAMSWISTSETISQTGARPVFVDVDDYFTIDVNKVEAKITQKTKAIIPVHLYGQPAEVKKIKEICARNNLYMIEDCAQAHFARYDDNNVGTFGNAATFSFYPGKNLGAYGDAGAIITDDDELADRLRMYANHGALKKHQHMMEGINSRLDGLQAAILSVKLKYIDDWNARRSRNAARYSEKLRDVPFVKTPMTRQNTTHIFHVYCVLAENRDELRDYLGVNGIETAIHYPSPLPFLQAYNYLGYKPTDFPSAHSKMTRLLSLPMYPELQETDIDNIVTCIKDFYGVR